MLRPPAWIVPFAAVLVPALAFADGPESRPGTPALKPWALGLSAQQLAGAYPEYFRTGADGRVVPLALPNVFFPGSGVLDVGNVAMKITNFGLIGNAFLQFSNDPSGQWPGPSGVEYLSIMQFAVGAVNPTATDPTAVRRVSLATEWRPPTLEPADDIYPAYDGILGGVRFSNDDGDRDFSAIPDKPRIDEETLDGRDNDGDGRIDEDYAALGQKMWSCTIRDDTPEAVNVARFERHAPLGLEVHQRAWAYSLSQFENFNVIEYEVVNRSGHLLDSLVVGWLVDMDSGPADSPVFFNDDLDVPNFPSGRFTLRTNTTDPRRQINHDPDLPIPVGVPLCPELEIRVNGFAVADDDGDLGRTPGIGSFLLFDHTVDELGATGPRDVGFRAFRSFIGGTPYTLGGNPTIDQQRFEFMTSRENISDDPSSPLYRFITAPAGDQKGDYQQWVSVGPWLRVENGQSIHVTIGFAVERGELLDVRNYGRDYVSYTAGLLDQNALFDRYPAVKNAFSAQVAFEGIWERREGFDVTTCSGCETPISVPLTGQTQFVSPPDCNPDGPVVSISPGQIGWFDFDCNYCTGVFDFGTRTGFFHKTWNASSPPPNPRTNVSVDYNYTDNPGRAYPPSRDDAILLAWDNRSETSADASDAQEFDFRGYKIWKVADWIRPVGSPGPSESEWQLLGEYRQFDYLNELKQPILTNRWWKRLSATDSVLVCPRVFVPEKGDSMDICLERGDLWNRQTGEVLRPDTTVPCVGAPGPCEVDSGCAVGVSPCLRLGRTRYPIGRYQIVDREVKNGFLYFYSVSAFDSTGSSSGVITELEGRRSAVEAEGVVPQDGTRSGLAVRVVPNPYRGFRNIAQRPSSWDLTPNGTDPTGTHIDFIGMPAGRWTLRIYTIAGDLVQELHSNDAVNESIRSPITQPDGGAVPGYNRQQDTANDGQARWNLISRNGQDIVSGVYVFTVESSQGTQRGRFVVVR